MVDVSSSPKKPGRPKKEDELTAKIVNMENCLAKMAHYTGAQRILDEFGIKRWEPTKKDLSKSRG